MKSGMRQPPEFEPTLGLFDALAVSVGAIVGGGIFVVTGIAAGAAGSSMIISMLLAAAISMLTASSFAELVAWQPKEGSIYEYSYQLISPFAGFLTGWMWILSNTFAGAAVSLGFAHYLAALVPSFPPNITAAVTCLAFTIVNYYGIRRSALLNNILVIAKLSVLAFFIVFGSIFIRPENYSPFVPLSTNVLYAAFYVFFAFGGFARTAVIAEEVKDAKHNVPRAIFLALLISTIVYVLVSVVAIGLLEPASLILSNSPLAEAMETTGNPGAVFVVSTGGVLATASVLLTSVLGVSRMMYAMARREHLPQGLSKLDRKRCTPVYSVLVVGSAMALLALLTDVTRVVTISTFSLLFYYTLANLAAFRLRPRKRNCPRIVAAIGATTCLIFLVFALFASMESWLIGATCLLAGIIYYGAKNRQAPP